MAGRIFTYLVVATPGEADHIVLWDTLDITVGRVAGQDVVLADPEVSRAHAAFVLEGERYQVDDQRTANGTYVNGVRVASHALRPGDEVQLGQTCITFRQEAESPMGSGTNASFASQLKGFDAPGGAPGEGGRTILGATPGNAVEGMGDEFADLGPLGEQEFAFGDREAPAAARDLDRELAEPAGAAWEDSALGMDPIEDPPKEQAVVETVQQPAASTQPQSELPQAAAVAETPVPVQEASALVRIDLEISGPKLALLAVVRALLDREISVPPFKLRLRKPG